MSHVFQLQNCGRIRTLFLSSCITHPELNFASLKERQNCFVYSGFTGKPQECLLMDRIWKFLFTNETESYLFSSRHNQTDTVLSLIWAPD